MRTTFFLLTISLLVLGTSSYSDVEVTNKRVGDFLSQQLKCQKPDDLQVSSLPGFLKVVMLSEGTTVIKHLPTSDIKVVTNFDHDVHITWKKERDEYGQGYMATTVSVPEKVLSRDEVMKILAKAIESGMNKR